MITSPSSFTVIHDLPHDHVPVQLHSHPRRLNSFYFISILIIRVHCHKLEQHQVKDSCNDSQPKDDEEQGEGDVLWLGLQGVVLLESHQVTKSSCRSESSNY